MRHDETRNQSPCCIFKYIYQHTFHLNFFLKKDSLSLSLSLSHRISCPTHHLEQTNSDTKPFGGLIGLMHMTTSWTFAYQSCVARCSACVLEFIRRIQKKYKSIIKIKQVVNGSDVSDSERFSFKTVSETEIKGLKNVVI